MSTPSPWISLVALSDELLPTPTAVAAQLAERFPDAPPLVATSETANGFTFTLGEATGAQATGNVTLVDRAIPWPQIEGPCAVAWYWPEAEQAMRSHPSHLFITLLDPAKDPIERAFHLTQLTVAVAATTPSVGLVWGPSSMVHKPVDFALLAEKMTRDDLPLHLWVDFRVFQTDEAPDVYNLFTTGLEPLGHQEFEATGYRGDPQEMVGSVYNISHYVLTDKPTGGRPVLKDGEAIGLPGEKQVNVRIEASQFDPAREVVRLDFE